MLLTLSLDVNTAMYPRTFCSRVTIDLKLSETQVSGGTRLDANVDRVDKCPLTVDRALFLLAREVLSPLQARGH